MSFIYEALKRAEDDNQQRVTAPARAHAASTVSRGRSRWWVWALIGVLAANALVVGAWMFVRSPRATREAAVAPPIEAPAPSAAAPTQPEAPAPSVAPPPPPRAPIATPAPRATPAEPMKSAPAEPMKSAPAIAAREPRAERPAARPTPDARVERSPAVAPPPARSAVPPERAAPPPPPAAASIDAPKVNLQVLVYSETPSQRMVFIDGRRHGEGDPIDGETVLERINADGIVVRHRGQRFVISEPKP